MSRFQPGGPHDEEPDAPPGQPIGDAIDTYLRRQGLSGASMIAAVVKAWPEVVGNEVANQARPRRIEGDALVVEVTHAAWATQLAFLSQRILSGLEGALGKPVAKRINVHVRGSLGVD